MEESMKHELRTKLRSGQTISEVCTEYHITFKELVGALHGYQNQINNRNHRKSWKYIQKRERDEAYILKYNKVYYGQYKTVNDAKKVRDYFLEYGWNKDNLDFVCKLLGVERMRKE